MAIDQVVDTSVILALLFVEPGHEAANDALKTGIVSAVTIGEAATVLTRRGGNPTTIAATLATIAERSLPVDRQQAIDAGCLHALTRQIGLSLGDRFCLALARQLRVPAVTADRAWLRIADAVGVEVRLIR